MIGKILCAFLASGAASLYAQTAYTWDGDGTGTPSGGSGIWLNGNSGRDSRTWWTGSTYESWHSFTQNLSVAQFAGTAGTVSLADPATVYSLLFSVGGYTLDSTVPGSARTLTLASGGIETVTGTTTFSSDIHLAGVNGLTKTGVGTLEILGSSTYTGGTLLSAGTVAVGNNAALSTGTISFNGGSIASTTDTITIANNLAVNSTTSPSVTGNNSLTLTGAATGGGTFEVALSDASKTVTLNQATTNAFAPAAVELSAGTLLLGGNDKIGDSTAITLSGGKLSSGGFNDVVGALTLTSTSTIDLAGGSGVFAFANSSTQTWTEGTQLAVWNWTGTSGAHLLFGTDSSGLTAQQLEQIVFYSDNGITPIGGGILLGNGEIVPIPEPKTIFASGALLGVAGVGHLRRRYFTFRKG